jgi:hypothetical protein
MSQLALLVPQYSCGSGAKSKNEMALTSMLINDLPIVQQPVAQILLIIAPKWGQNLQ